MVIRQFKILATGQIWDGFYLQDGSGDIQCLTNKGYEIFYEWEFEWYDAGTIMAYPDLGTPVTDNLNECFMTSREKMIKLLGKKLPIVGTTEDFDGSPDGIWICGEGGYSNKKGIPYFDYYDLGGLYTFGVLDELWNFAEKHGWYFEWYDAGTIMCYPG